MTDHQRRAIRHARIAAFCLCLGILIATGGIWCAFDLPFPCSR